MSSAPDSIAAGTILQHYRLVERLGGAAQTWIAEDTRNGNKVAVRILSRLLPKDKATRDSALKQLRLKAAIGHPGIANIIQIGIDNDVLWMASELVDGETLSARARREKASKQSFLRHAWQMADILAAVHRGGIVLGQITGESWIITPDNDVRLVGFRFSSFMGKHDTGQTLLSTIKPTNLREAAYLSPEQVAGKMVTSRTDIFALGVCLYELIAGALPFQGSSVADVAHAVSTASPPAPQNPAIERSLLGPVGKCIHKNPDNRYEKITLLKDDLAKLAPDVESMAHRRGVTSPGGIPLPKKAAAAAAEETFIVVGELPYHDLLRKKDPERAGRLENTMQQYLSEAVYLFDGKVLDSLGPRMVASMPDGESAIRAAQKGLADLVEHNMTHGDQPVEARMLVHYGELIPTAGRPEGSGLTTTMAVLEAMEPLQLLVSRPVIERVDVEGEPELIGRLADIDFFRPPEIREPQPEAPAAPVPVAPIPAAPPDGEGTAAAADAVPTSLPEPPPIAGAEKKGTSVTVLGIGAVLVLAVGVAGAIFVLTKGGDTTPPPVAQATAPRPTAPANVEIDPDKIFFQGITVDALVPAEQPADVIDGSTGAPAAPEVAAGVSDPDLEPLAAELEAALTKLMALDRALEPVQGPSEDARSIGGRLSTTAEGLVLTPVIVNGGVESMSEPVNVVEPLETALAYVKSVWPSLGRNLAFLPARDDTVQDYLEALEHQAGGDLSKALASCERVTEAQSDFVAGQRLRMDLLLALDRADQAVEVARRVALLDPKDTEIRRRLADWELASGNPGYGLVWMGELLQVEPENVEILTRIGQYAIAVGNEEKFKAVMARLAPLEVEHPRLSEGDLILARGRLDAAARKYYEDLNTQPDNPILSLKIGRIAVLRRSDSVMQAELERLQRLQAPFELAMMQAYLDANAGNAEGAALELRRAEETAGAFDPVYTATAEVYLLLNRQQQVLEALEKAVARAEPTHEYITSNPVFGYLSNDPRFRTVLQTLGEQRTQISAALDEIQL